MIETTSEKIIRLCSSWRSAANPVPGGFILGEESEQFRLVRNGVQFHDLSFDELRTAIACLTEALLLPNLISYTGIDHCFLWAWCAELLLSPLPPHNRHKYLKTEDLRKLAEAAVRAAYPTPEPEFNGPEEQMAFWRQRSSFIPTHDRELLSSRTIISVYLNFPFLEAVCRQACAAYVGPDGEVLTTFKRLNGHMYQVGKWCSSVADLLNLIVEDIGSPDLVTDMRHILGLVGQHCPSRNGIEQIYRWRNSTLHGEQTYAAIGGTILTLALRIALEELSSDYETARQIGCERAAHLIRNAQFGSDANRGTSEFYPPFV